MFNHRIIFRFFSLVFIAGIFFGLNNVLGACTLGTESPRIGYGVAGNSTNPTTCASITGSGPQRFNNNSVNDTQLQTFLKSYGFTYQTITCGTPSTAAGLVRNLQSNLVSKGCTTCIDGKYGGHTQAMLSQCVPVCNTTQGKKPVNLQGPICDPGYTHNPNIGCCIADCSDPKMPIVNSGCATPGWTGDGAGCCINPCPDPKTLPTNGSCSVANGLTGDGAGCCIVEPKLCNNTFTQSNRNYWVSTTFPSIASQFDKSNCCWKEANVYSKPPLLSGITTFCDGLTGCLDPLKSLSGGSCTLHGTTRNPNGAGCCKECSNPPISGACSGPNKVENNCCVAVPNQCTGSKAQYGVFSGNSYSCQTCGSGTTSNADHTKCICDSTQKCCGIQLNTVVPFIGDCIEMSNDESAGNTTRVNALNAFPILMGSLSKMLVTAILIFSFVMVVIGGVLITAGGIDPGNAKKGKDIIGKVIVGLALLGASGIILRLINPNFFG
ncbi:MAG: pilin [Candidatus Absconditicoccaceae bacterium]